MFFGDTSRLKVKVIFHSSNFRLPEVQQLGYAALSPAGFRLHLAPNRKGPGLDVAVPLAAVTSMRAFHKKSYSSESYLVRVEYRDTDGVERMVCFEMRGFFRKARVQTMAWKDLWGQLQGNG
jgi:hypothetical protein